jgi:hypothetical protein
MVFLFNYFQNDVCGYGEEWRVLILLHGLYGRCKPLAPFRVNSQASRTLAAFVQLLTPIFFGWGGGGLGGLCLKGR